MSSQPKATYNTLMQSKFFHPAFNSALFDGPVRLYFAQFHESLALKIYFTLQQKFPEAMAKAKQLHQIHGHNLMVMLYPTKDSFEYAFDGAQGFMEVDQFDDDQILGINGPFEDDQILSVVEKLIHCMGQWQNLPLPAAFEEAQM